MNFTEGGQEWIEVTTPDVLASGVRTFMRGKTIHPSTVGLALLREKCFELAESWTDDGEVRHPQHYAYELKRILA